MVRRLNLLSGMFLAVVIAVLGSTSQSFSATSNCTAVSRQLGLCASVSASADATGVDVKGKIDQVHRGTSSSVSDDNPHGRPLSDEELLALLDEACYGDGVCGERTTAMLNPRLPQDPAADAADGMPAADVTIEDLARFLPATTALHAEPDGWAVVGVPANFWVDVAPMTVTGELLGGAAQVRFTPQAYRFDYGDGVTKATAAPGRSWEALGQEELTATPTSHRYTARGTREAAVTVVYSAQYRVADGTWIAVAGAVQGTTPPQPVLVVVERTALTTPA